MTTSKSTTRKAKPANPAQAKTGDTDPKYVGEDTLNAKSANAAQAAAERVKDAIPSFDEMADTLRDRTNIDFQNMADDAATFVRRNPAASLAAAAGIGILIGVLATKRS
ncbi:hypothetical protein [uncultured Sulfitobacter sp.]|uniref:hypothetical protein n=1 Tax=uncultured Sulfitobacter sp. TaxID=191468 RepID=UPI002607E33A|nr:hypothetical protein [uncultured Sulfitobacter sp.]